MYTVTSQIENGFQNSKHKETHDFTKDFTFVPEVIKFQDRAFWQHLKVV